MDVLEIDVPLKWIHEEMSSPGPHVTCPPAEMIQVSVQLSIPNYCFV